MRALLILLAVVVVLGIVAVATGFVNLSGHAGSMPKMVGGSLPSVQADVGKVVVGSKQTAVDVPKVEVGTKQETVQVPTVGVQKPDGK